VSTSDYSTLLLLFRIQSKLKVKKLQKSLVIERCTGHITARLGALFFFVLNEENIHDDFLFILHFQYKKRVMKQ
jgi:hypothetical protein